MNNNILDEKILKTQAFSFLHEFLVDIINVFPEYKDNIVEKYNPFLSREQDRIQGDNQEKCDIVMEFLNNISKYNKQITDKDDSLFKDDIYLLHKINFKTIWCSKITESTRNKIWSYLQTFSMLSITINSNKDLKKIMNSLNDIVTGSSKSGENKELNLVLKNLKKLSTSLSKEDDDKAIPSIPEGDKSMEDNFNKLFSGSKIGDLAKEIAGDLNVEEMVKNNKGNPEDLLKNIFSGDKEKGGFNIMNVVENISNKINKKINDGDIKEDDLMKEAQKMMSNIQGDSLFGNLFNQMGGVNKGSSGAAGMPGMPDMANMLNQMTGSGGGNNGTPGIPDMSNMFNMLSNGASQSEPDISSDRNVAARQKLQQKLKNRQETKK
jgi:hypothetical protein